MFQYLCEDTRLFLPSSGASFTLPRSQYQNFLQTLKPSAHSTIFVVGDNDLVFFRQRRKRISSMFDIEDRRQRQKSFLCVSRTQQIFVASDKNCLPQRQKSSSSAKIIFDLNDKNRAVCARF